VELFMRDVIRKVAAASVILTAACGGGVETPQSAEGIAFIGVAAAVDACETMPVIEVSAMRGGQRHTGYSGDITISIQPGTGVPAGVLSGTRTMKALAGVASFTDLSINASGTGYRLNIAASGAGSITTAAFDVVPGGPDQLGFTASPPVNSATLAFPPVRVAVRDACGATILGSSAPVTLSFNANSSSATLLGTTTVNAVNGVATFLDLAASKAGPGFTLAAVSPGLRSAQSVAFTVAAPPGQ
jgi:hypothetical protein